MYNWKITAKKAVWAAVYAVAAVLLTTAQAEWLPIVRAKLPVLAPLALAAIAAAGNWLKHAQDGQ